MPPTLVDRLYVDFTASLAKAKPKIEQAIANYVGLGGLKQEDAVPTTQQHVVISSVRLQIMADTAKCYGGLISSFDRNEVREEASELLKFLRRRANGVLLNFIPVAEMSFTSPSFKFPNGNLVERIEDIGGPFEGSIAMQAVVDVEVLNPEEGKLNRLISSKLESLGVGRVVYSFSLSLPIPDLPQRSLRRLQETYDILGWDSEQGAEVELPDDLHLSVRCTEEEIDVALETKYRFQFQKRAKDFSVREFVDWLLRDS